MNDYINLHRHAAVRAELAKHGGVALRALAAHVIANTGHFSIDTQSYRCGKDAVQESVETCEAETHFDERRRAVLAVLGFDPEDLTVTGKRFGGRPFAPIFARLLELPDPVVLEIVAIVMGETLMAGSEAVEQIGCHLDVDMAKVWTADAAFWGLIRDKEVLGKIVAEVAGGEVAAANAGEKAAIQKGIITDHLGGINGRPKIEGWVPRWLKFEPSSYTSRGGVGSVNARDRLLDILARAAETAARREEGAKAGDGDDAAPDAEDPDAAGGDDPAAAQVANGDGAHGDEEETPLAA